MEGGLSQQRWRHVHVHVHDIILPPVAAARPKKHSVFSSTACVVAHLLELLPTLIHCQTKCPAHRCLLCKLHPFDNYSANKSERYSQTRKNNSERTAETKNNFSFSSPRWVIYQNANAPFEEHSAVTAPLLCVSTNNRSHVLRIRISNGRQMTWEPHSTLRCSNTWLQAVSFLVFTNMQKFTPLSLSLHGSLWRQEPDPLTSLQELRLTRCCRRLEWERPRRAVWKCTSTFCAPAKTASH